MNVWTYWKCPYCDSINRGDLRECPDCGHPIPNNVKYLMPDNPIVQTAMANGTIKTKDDLNVDSKGIVSEIVPKEKERFEANWKCAYCGCQNRAEDSSCLGCGRGKEESECDYFDRPVKMTTKDKADFKNRRGVNYEDSEYADENDAKTTFESNQVDDLEYDNEEENSSEPISDDILNYDKPTHRFTDPSANSRRTQIKNTLISAGIISSLVGLAIGFVFFLIWLFTPIERTSHIEQFSWTRSISVEEFQLVHEKGWSVPSDGRITNTREEIHHYNTVLDHYETKTRQVSEQVLDHYETEYHDLGNGQATTSQYPVYKTVYRTETYQEPVYKQVPVYQTRYYYDVDRWKYSYELRTKGLDQNPYWSETDIPEDVSNPEYGDLRLSTRRESYSIHFKNDKGTMVEKTCDYNEWKNYQQNSVVKYKTFRFSHKPLP